MRETVTTAFLSGSAASASSTTETTVSETPSTAIEPLPTT
jgi:hypothetical protein